MLGQNAEREFMNKPTRVYIGPIRKDGKHPIQFCYYKKRIKKLYTPEKIAAELYRKESYYLVFMCQRPHTDAIHNIAYEARVQALEAEGMTRSDAQAVVDAELLPENDTAW